VVAERRQAPHPVGVLIDRADPVLIVNPRTDAAFTAGIEAALDSGAATPEALADALRPEYPMVHVRERGLAGDSWPVWYVYRDGRWVGSPDPV
jgi:hypothetical protein